ncbi:TPA: T6SS effector BTH_I2691 family protein [Klebsiella aerogenes]
MSNHQCDCKAQGPALLPVRYAVVPDSIEGELPQWARPATSDYPHHDGYHYALRAMRRGFIYIYYPHIPSWEAWSVSDDGSLWKQLSAENVQPKSQPDCIKGSYNQGGKDFITLPAHVLENDIWIAFSQRQWSKTTLDSYQNDSDRREARMQCLSQSHWDRPTSTAPVTDATEDSLSAVLDYISMRGNQLSPAQLLPYEGVVDQVSYFSKYEYHLCDETLPQWRRWRASLWGEEIKAGSAIKPQWTLYPWRPNRAVGSTLQQMQQRGVSAEGTPVKPLMMALHDATGIIHELTGWANGILALQQKFADERQVELSTLNLINGVRQLIINSNYPRLTERLEKTQLGQAAMDETYRRYLEDKKKDGTDVRDIRSREDFETWNTRGYIDSMAFSIAADELEKYDWMLNPTRLGSFNETVDLLTTRVSNLLTWLIEFRIEWLQTPLFIAETQDFNSNDPVDNLSYREIVAFAISGIDIHPHGQLLLDRWIAEYSTANAENLVWRTHFYNNPEIMAEAEALLTLARQAETDVVLPEQVLEFFDANSVRLIKIFKGFEKATDALKSNLAKNSVLSQKVLYSMDQYMATVGARIFSATGIGRILDNIRGVIIHAIFSLSAGKSVAQTKAFASRYFGWMYERHTYISGSVFYNPDKPLAKANVNLAKGRFDKLNETFAEYGQEQEGAAVFKTTSIRILVTFLNIYELGNLYRHRKGDAASQAKIASSALVTTSGIIDVAMPAMEKAWQGKNGLQYLKMSGAGCTMIASAILLGLDVAKVYQEYNTEQRELFLGLYSVKVLSDLAAIFKANGKLLEALIARFGWETAVASRGTWLGRLVKPALSPLIAIEWVGLLSSWQVSLLIMLVDYVATQYYSRDELQKWFEQGIFGNACEKSTDDFTAEDISTEIARCQQSLEYALNKMAEPQEEIKQDVIIQESSYPLYKDPLVSKLEEKTKQDEWKKRSPYPIYKG